MGNSFLGTYGDDNSNPYGSNELNPDIFPAINQIVGNVDSVTKGIKNNIERRIKKLRTRLDRMGLPDLAILENQQTTFLNTPNSFGPNTLPTYDSPSDCPRTCRIYFVYLVVKSPNKPQPFGNDFTCLVTELEPGRWEVICRDVPYAIMKLYLGNYESEWNYPWRCSEPCDGQPPDDDTHDPPDNPTECPPGFHFDGFHCVPDIVITPPMPPDDDSCCQVINNITTSPPNVNVTCPPPTIVVNTKPDTIKVFCNPWDVDAPPIKVVIDEIKVTCPPPQITIVNNVKCGNGDGEEEKPKPDCESECSELEGEEKEDCIAACNEPNWLRFLISKAGQKKMMKYAEEMKWPTRFMSGGPIMEDMINMKTMTDNLMRSAQYSYPTDE